VTNAAAEERLERWNERNPDTEIEITARQIAQRVKNKGLTRAERLEKTAPREMRN
jgi:hypothetical protein